MHKKPRKSERQRKKEENFLFAAFGALAFWLGQLVLVYKMNMLFSPVLCLFSTACVLRIANFSMHCILFSVHVTVFFSASASHNAPWMALKLCIHIFYMLGCAVLISEYVHILSERECVCTWWKTSFRSAFKYNRQTEFSFCYKNGQFEIFVGPFWRWADARIEKRWCVGCGNMFVYCMIWRMLLLGIFIFRLSSCWYVCLCVRRQFFIAFYYIIKSQKRRTHQLIFMNYTHRLIEPQMMGTRESSSADAFSKAFNSYFIFGRCVCVYLCTRAAKYHKKWYKNIIELGKCVALLILISF